MKTKDVYTWRVVYTDGTATSEFDESRPDGCGFAEKEKKPVQALTLARVDAGKETHHVLVPDGAEPVFFRRRSIVLDPTGEGERKTIHCIGWKQGEQAVYLFVHDDGSTLLTDDLQAV